jgi:hypothetical protein
MGHNGVTGSGVLATITFRAVGVGSGTIDLGNLAGAQGLYGPPIYENAPPTTISYALSNSLISVIPPTNGMQLPNVDFNNDGAVNFRDILHFVTAYINFNQHSTLDIACDLNQDGKLNFSDIQLFVNAYVNFGRQSA